MSLMDLVGLRLKMLVCMTKGGLGRCEFPRLAAMESPLSFCRPRPTRRRVWNDRDGSFTLLFQHFNVLTLTF